MRTYALEVRGPVDGASVDRRFEWRVRDVESGEIVLEGATGTEDLAVQEGREQARSLHAHGSGPGRPVNDTPALVPPPTPQPLPPPTPQPPPARRRAVPWPSARTTLLSAPAPVDPMDVVRALLPQSSQLPVVSECCQDMLDKAMVEVGADAGAVLLRDGDAWKVTAGSELRPLELRVELSATHWLIRTVCTERRGITVKDTDIARQQLAGAPLASKRHLLAVPLTVADGLLLLARRGDPSFKKDDLGKVTRLSQSAAEALGEAIDVLRLARALAMYAEEPV